MNTDHATNFLFAMEHLQFRFSCGVNALGAIHTAMEEGASSPECYLDGLFGIYRHLCDLSDELEKNIYAEFQSVRDEKEKKMNELIKVDFSGEKPAVSARELHEFLGVETPYHKWFPRMCEYGFIESEDYLVTDIFVHNPAGGPQSMKDAALSIDMAKEICMIQRNEKGKMARQYFLALERDWNSPERVMARALEIAHKKLRCLEEQRELDRPKVLFANAVAAARTSILVGELAKVLKQNGVDMGQNRLFTWLRDNGYLIRRNGSDYNMPTQKAMEMGLFEIKETVVAHADGHTDTKKTPKVTGRGQQYFISKFLGT